MDIERALISKCVNDAVIEKVVSRGIGPQHFDDDESRNVFQTIVSHMSTYGAPPSRDVVLAKHGCYRLDVVQDTLDYIIDVFVKKVQEREARRSVLDLASALDKRDPDMDLDTLFMEHAERVAQAIPSSRISKLSDAPSRIELYNRMLKAGRIDGYPFGIPSIDREVLGVQGHELCVVSAAGGVGKSTMLQYIALAGYMTDPTHRPCFISLEMDGQALLQKFDSMATHIQSHAMRSLELGSEAMKKWEDWGDRVSRAPNDIIIIDDIDDCTVERVFAEMLRWKPSAMFVDYFGIMTPSVNGEKMYQGMAQMAKAMKRIPRRTGIPLFTAAQMNRDGYKAGGVKAENVADTIEIFRSADIMIGLERDEEETPKEMLVKLIKHRNGRKAQTIMDWDLDRSAFSERTSFGKKERPAGEAVPATPIADFQAKRPELTSNDPAQKTNPFAL
jgi:replicative DNA helicase